MKALGLIFAIGGFFFFNQHAKASGADAFLNEQKAFNQYVYGISSENARRAQRGGFSRANFSLVDTTATDEQIIAALIEKNIVPTAKVICGRSDSLNCAKAIANKELRVLPRIPFTGVMPFIQELKSWSLSEKWTKDLQQVESGIKDLLGNDFIEYMIGYNDDVELFNLILISKDRTKAIVLNASLLVNTK